MGRLGLSLCGWLLAAALIAPPAFGQDAPPPPPESTEAPPEGVFSTRRIAGESTQLSRVPGAITVITAEDIARSGASTIQQVLRRAPGVKISDTTGFGLGSDGTVNLRGVINSSRAGVLVLVDGVRQNRITGDEIHWQSIPVDQIERIEILRGGSGLIYGEGALAGVINIITKHETADPFHVEEGSEFGSYGWQKHFLGARGQAEGVRYGIHGTRRLVQGYRESSQSRNTTVNAHAGVDIFPELALDAHIMHSDDTTGFPGLLTLAQTQARRTQTNSFHGINTNDIDQASVDLTAGPWDGWTGTANVFWRRWVQHSEDTTPFNAFTVVPSRGLNLRSNHEWRGATVENLFVSGLELSEDKATTGSSGIFAGPDSESNRQGYGFYLEDTLTVAERVSLIGGLRFDQFRYEEHLAFPSFIGTLRFQGWSPKVGVTIAAVPDRLDLFAIYARPFKSPNVDDFSSRLGSMFTGNADLKPQQADSYELGMRAKQPGLEASATGFFNRIEDEILFNGITFTNDNFNTRRFGVELAAKVEPPESRVRASASYMFIDAEFRNGAFHGNNIPGTPQHTFTMGAGVSPLDRLWLDLEWELVHDFRRINDLANTLGGGDNYGLLNLICRYELPHSNGTGPWQPTTAAFLRIDNVTNEEYVEFHTSNGLNMAGAGEAPMPPTTVTVGVTFTF